MALRIYPHTKRIEANIWLSPDFSTHFAVIRYCYKFGFLLYILPLIILKWKVVRFSKSFSGPSGLVTMDVLFI